MLNQSGKVRGLVSVAALLLMTGACGDSTETGSSDTAASPAGEVRQLTFTGSDCLYEGPEEVTAGSVTVELVNDSDGLINIFVGALDEGKTVQDLMDVFGPEPRFGALEPFVSDMGGQTPARAGETMRWESNLTAGVYVTSCVRTNTGAWFGGGFTVVDG